MRTPPVPNSLRSLHVVRTSVNGASAGAFEFCLRYVRTDPYAVWMTFDGTDMCCARDLLLDALEGGAAGDGDIRIHCDEAYTHIELPQLGCRVTVHVPRAAADRFAVGTLDVVARGEESQHMDVDAAIAGIVSPA